MTIKPYWVVFPVAIGFCFFGALQFAFGNGFFIKGVLLSIPGYILHAATYFLLRKSSHVIRSRESNNRLKGIFFFILMSLLITTFGVGLILSDTETCMITFIVVNTALSFIYLCYVLNSAPSDITLKNTEGTDGNRYNPSSGLPTYSGYIDVKGSPVGVRTNKN